MNILGSVGQLYMFVLLALLFLGSGFALWWFINFLIERGILKQGAGGNPKQNGQVKTNQNNNETNKVKGGHFMANNGWIRLAIFSFVGIIVSIAVLGLASTGNTQGMNMNGQSTGIHQQHQQQNGNMNMQGGMNTNTQMGNMNMQGGMNMNTPMGNMQMQGNMNGGMSQNEMMMMQQLNQMQMQLNQMQQQMGMMNGNMGGNMQMQGGINNMQQNSGMSNMGGMGMMNGMMGMMGGMSSMPQNNSNMNNMPQNNSNMNNMPQNSGSSSGGGMGMM